VVLSSTNSVSLDVVPSIQVLANALFLTRKSPGDVKYFILLQFSKALDSIFAIDEGKFISVKLVQEENVPSLIASILLKFSESTMNYKPSIFKSASVEVMLVKLVLKEKQYLPI
jgi:hypothetical protein